jgi:D-alanyl-D-alanine carboxypeptidase (penicillin-binding protein 5/6)
MTSGTTDILEASATADTVEFWDSIVSGHGVLIDVEQGSILAQRGAKERINPASMTKIMTVLVAAEHVTDLDDTFTMTIDITDYSYVNDCSNVGYEIGEVMSVRDLFYGTVLPSGGDAAVALATYVAGSQDAFVDMMNEKAAELGLSDSTHFTNCVGIYNEEHYSTPYDMAVMLKAAVDNPWCREVLSTHVYTTEPSEEHPDGIVLSNWFLRRIEDKDTHGEVVCAKTGYVTQSGNCAASYATDENGKSYICVTAGASSVWRCIYDQTELYAHFLPESVAKEE